MQKVKKCDTYNSTDFDNAIEYGICKAKKVLGLPDTFVMKYFNIKPEGFELVYHIHYEGISSNVLRELESTLGKILPKIDVGILDVNTVVVSTSWVDENEFFKKSKKLIGFVNDNYGTDFVPSMVDPAVYKSMGTSYRGSSLVEDILI